MQQEVPVIIHAKGDTDAQRNPAGDGRIPESIREISDSLSDAFSRFRESESYDRILEGAEQTKDYIRQNPGPSLLYALGAGVLLGLILGKRR
ncbi:MAG: hypothetical protein A3K90_08170 [Pelodictyon luteolum]|uniref:DUF883 domain-containing protein n=1 Tax=Pelodictyon luteolum TaxID=1100 RepID=A0A165L5C7_PELLU|nr:hypothetical protein [Pelodictyon luteolum]KZK73584.1 MAG: hypothetical protein A3K90_08170 [Pelodictyon luteolum]